MTKYIFLYNYLEGEYDRKILERIKKLIPEIVVKPFAIIGGEIISGKSIWVPEHKYLIAWTLWNYDDLIKGIQEEGDYPTVDEGLEWYENHRNKDIYVWMNHDSEGSEADFKKMYRLYIKAMQLLEELQDKMTFEEFSKYMDILEYDDVEMGLS